MPAWQRRNNNNNGGNADVNKQVCFNVVLKRFRHMVRTYNCFINARVSSLLGMLHVRDCSTVTLSAHMLLCRVSVDEAGETKAKCVHHSWSADDNSCRADVLCRFIRGTVSCVIMC